MRQRDMMNTGRADFVVPASRLNDGLFSVFRWQTPTPGSPGEGNIGSTQMTFFDGAGPGGADIVTGTYHWPKGIQGMNRHDGRVLWYGNPNGGETIGTIAAAFSANGSTVYVVNDATGSSSYPGGFPLMAFATATGPGTFRHNGADPNPWQLSAGSPTVAPNGRIFMHSWVDRPYAGTDSGSAIATTWAAESYVGCGLADPALYQEGTSTRVVIGGRGGTLYCFDGASAELMWATVTGYTIDSPATIDPANGNVYVAAGSDSVAVVGVNKNGQQLWSSTAKVVYQRTTGEAQRAQSAGCLSHDGSTYYFQTNSIGAQGRLYAVNTADGSLKWSFGTASKGWEAISSSPIVTPNGVIFVGNNENGVYYAIQDAGDHGQLIDSIQASDGTARASASLAPDGKLYIPIRTTWSVPNGGGGIPTSQVENLFTCVDLSEGAVAVLAPPAGQAAVALNAKVTLSWKPITDPNGVFDHYAVYRSTSAFTSVSGKMPIGTVSGVSSSGYTDSTAANGTRYYYAVTSVSAGGGEYTTINSIGPYTPRNETDLQVTCISRTPRYPRYAAQYSYYNVTEPSGFGPYGFSSSYGLGSGQTGSTQRWPNVGDPVTYTASVRNRGTNNWSGTLSVTWKVDGLTVSQPSKSVTLVPGAVTQFTYVRNWDGQAHDIDFVINVTDARPANNSLQINTKSVAFLTYADITKIEQFRENTPVSYPQAQTNDLFDWLNRHMARFNEMFMAAGSPKRVHYDILEALSDSAPDPAIDTLPFAIFPFRYRTGEGDPRGSGYYHADEDIDYGLLHEMGHQLGLIDIYQLDVPSSANYVSGQGYSAVAGLMHGCSPFLSDFSAKAMTHWLDKAHGYYGQFMYNLPQNMRLRILGFDGRPLAGASVKMYQYCERPGVGKVITDQVKAQGVTDASGYFALPNVPINTGMVPPAYTGDTLHPNPFGYLAVVGTNGVLHFKVEYRGGVDYCWLDVTEAMVAYFDGETSTATFDRQMALGGDVQFFPPDDMAELNAPAWDAWAEGSTSLATYTVDDTVRKVVGSGSVKFVTDGGFDTSLRYPRTLTAQWDLRTASKLRIRFYAINPNGSFQNSSPWIRLKDANGNYFQYQYYVNGSPYELLNQARNQWLSVEIPLDASSTVQNGWRRTTLGTPDLAHINSLEIHSDTWGSGFTLWVDGVNFVFASAPVESMAAAKAAADNTRVRIPEAVVTAAWPDYFYAELADRSMGIRVEKAAHGLVEGDVVEVVGILKTTATGERAVDASWATAVGGP